MGRIENIDRTEDKEQIRVNFGVPICLINKDAIDRVSIFTDQILKKGLKKSKESLLNNLSLGENILVSVSKIDPDGKLTCDLESKPRVQGAAIVLDKGKIAAMVGGFSPNEYNRAIFAERQPGSTFKLPTYYAALQMGWSVLDPLSNIRDVFTWQGNFYFPRPDHIPTTLETTILGAGAKSENLASIWLLKHMLDKINYNQYLDLQKFLDVSSESSTDTISTIANKFNATPDNVNSIKEGILESPAGGGN